MKSEKVVWLLNLYNFMDGIDGIAGVEAVTVALAACLLAWLAGLGVEAWWPMLLLAAGVAGFLVWNWPPARIFMGDAGSGFIGLMLGLLSIQAAQLSFELLAGWLVLLAVFVTDATLTLLRRLLRGQPLTEAHRSHAYQYAARRLGGHRSVTLAVAGINLLWLLPIAALMVTGWLATIPGLVLAYAPLVGLAWWLKAGAAEMQEV
jgi:Fuc2NAc and GlcNAc transferase